MRMFSDEAERADVLLVATSQNEAKTIRDCLVDAGRVVLCVEPRDAVPERVGSVPVVVFDATNVGAATVDRVCDDFASVDAPTILLCDEPFFDRWRDKTFALFVKPCRRSAFLQAVRSASKLAESTRRVRPTLFGLRLADLERRAIVETLERVGTKSRAARVLGVSEKTIYNKLKQYGLFESYAALSRRPAANESRVE
ncbi:MAG: helix-turn-helix domain-containing protein [Thermoguttaceae bacterium]|nr:helix-turn-helix domain-containing protein [Thermoguttaceae bacterium]